jgi:putative DNA-invertase from lambdoid prophage Rac
MACARQASSFYIELNTCSASSQMTATRNELKTELIMTIFAYSCVSATDLTAEQQRLEIEQAGYQVDYWFKDEDINGKTCAGKRPQFNALLAKIRDGETMVVTKLDRLGRDAIDVARTIKTLAARKIQVIVLQFGKLDITSASGKLMLNMLGAVADLERDLRDTRAKPELAKAETKTPKKTNTISEQQHKEVLARLNGGESVKVVARAYGVPRIHVMRINAAM